MLDFILEVRATGTIGKEENMEEVFAPLLDVFSVLTDTTLAQSWGRTPKGSLIYPQDNKLKVGHIVDVIPHGMKQSLKVKVRLIHHLEFVEMEIIEGPMFGNLKFAIETRPYGTMLSVVLDYRIESLGFNIKWKLSEKKRYREMIDSVLDNIKSLSEMRRASPQPLEAPL